MNKEFVWTDAEVKKILHAATGNIKDFVMNEDGFISEFKASHTTEPNRDWEIVSVKNKKTKDTWPYKEPFYPEYWDIHSVRRLLDNSIWTVGEDTPKGKIKEFEMPHPEGNIYVRYDLGGWDYLYQCAKPIQRTPLFKDFNGNQVYVGDDFFIVVWDDWRIHKHTSNQSDIGFWKRATTFNSRESAEQYVLMNKPCLSVNDVIKAFEDWKHENEFFEDYIKQFAKQKLNKQ